MFRKENVVWLCRITGKSEPILSDLLKDLLTDFNNQLRAMNRKSTLGYYEFSTEAFFSAVHNQLKSLVEKTENNSETVIEKYKEWLVMLRDSITLSENLGAAKIEQYLTNSFNNFVGKDFQTEAGFMLNSHQEPGAFVTFQP